MRDSVTLRELAAILMRRAKILIRSTGGGAALLLIIQVIRLICGNGNSWGAALVSVLKYAVLGAVLGLAAGCIWVIVGYLFYNRVESANEMGRSLQIPYLGAVVPDKDLWSCRASRILGEPQWRGIKESKDYFATAVSIRVEKEKKIALLTTLKQASLSAVTDTLHEQGYSVTEAVDAPKSADALLAIKNSDVVILAERLGVSDYAKVEKLVQMAGELDRPVGGYVMI
ncbi:MAG: hypothetical protein GXW99_07490 [Clostridiales bacterium]|nr:hypothetical protein [Clostridiales bacterium]